MSTTPAMKHVHRKAKSCTHTVLTTIMRIMSFMKNMIFHGTPIRSGDGNNFF